MESQMINLTFFQYLKECCHATNSEAKLATPPSFLTLAFQNGMGYCYVISEITGQKFTNVLHNIDTSSLLFVHPFR